MKREWSAGDRVELALPMPVERVYAHPKVQADCGRVALRRGPVVYCLEEADNGAGLDALCLPRQGRAAGEVPARTCSAAWSPSAPPAAASPRKAGRTPSTAPPTARAVPARLTAVPYYAWCNRQPGEMLVWVREC